MSKKIFIALFLLILSTKGFSSEIDTVFDRAYSLLNHDFDSAITQVKKYNRGLASVSIEEQEEFHHKAALFYGVIADFGQEIHHWEEKLKLLPESSDTLHLTEYRLAMAYLNSGDFEKSFEIHKLNEAYFLRKGNPKMIAASYNGLANVHSHTGSGLKAIEYYLASIQIFKKLQDFDNLCRTYSNMGIAYIELGENQKAFEVRNKAYKYALLTKNEADIHFCEMDLGSAYNQLGQFDSAVYYVQKAETYFEENFNAQILNAIYNELGAAYSELGFHDKAEQYYIQSIDLLKTGGFDFALPGTMGNYGRVLHGKGDYDKGIMVCKEAMPTAKRMGYLEVEMVLCSCLYDNYKSNNNADSALYYFEQLQMLSDSVSNVELQKAVLEKELASSFSQEKEGIIAGANAVIEDEKGLRNVWIVGAIILFVALVLLYLAFRQKQKSNKIIHDEKHYLDNLLHNLVHEFRTPLTLIKGPTEELLKKDSENKLLQLVDKNSDQMLVLVNQVLDFAKIKAGRLEVNNEITNLKLFTNDTIALFRPKAEEKKIFLINELSVKNVTVYVDVDKLFKIVSNLLTNAIKYSNEQATVTLKTTIEERVLVLVVSDTGIGISPEDQSKVFNKFYQVDATITRKGEGTGLGLAFVSELVQLMGGEITLNSVLGKGTNVEVRIPIELAKEQKEEVVRTVETVHSNERKLMEEGNDLEENKRKILIVEDNKDLQDFLSQILEDQGYEMYRAMDGLQGVQMAEELMPDLVISDVMMPKMDGYQLVQQLKNKFATEHIPIIMLTAKASFDSMIDGLGAGADDYVSKPFKSQELLLRIANQINRQEKLQQKYLNESSSDKPIVKHALVEKIESITQEDLGVQISVEELAEKCALSRSQLHRKVKFITGLSTSALLTKIRMDLAFQDIQNTDLSVSEIAYKYGYNDPAHFSKLFKKQFDTTPSEARKTVS